MPQYLPLVSSHFLIRNLLCLLVGFLGFGFIERVPNQCYEPDQLILIPGNTLIQNYRDLNLLLFQNRGFESYHEVAAFYDSALLHLQYGSKEYFQTQVNKCDGLLQEENQQEAFFLLRKFSSVPKGYEGVLRSLKGRYCQAIGRYDSAAIHFQQGKALDPYPARGQLLYLGYMAGLMEAMGNLDSAQSYLSRYEHLEEKTRFEIEDGLATGWGHGTELDSLRNALPQLNQVQASIALKNRQQQQTIFSLGGFALLVLFVAALLWQRGRSVRFQRHYLETLLRQLHHSLANSLFQLEAMLAGTVRQALSPEDQKWMLQEAASRVRTMSELHKKMYTTEELSGNVELCDYITRLAEGLLETYNMQHVTLRITPIPLTLSMKTVLALGVVCSELITNAIKYGLGQPAPALEIVLWNEHGLAIEVRDSGGGSAEGIAQRESTGYGQRIVEALIEQQLHGKVERHWDAGTVVRLWVPPKSLE